MEGSWYRHTNNTQPVLCQLKITNDVFLFSRQREDGRQDGEMDQENAP